jgi:hypothetical protein
MRRVPPRSELGLTVREHDAVRSLSYACLSECDRALVKHAGVKHRTWFGCNIRMEGCEAV